jgi:meiotically up-regulated gene 157 (Mug157) protein
MQLEHDDGNGSFTRYWYSRSNLMSIELIDNTATVLRRALCFGSGRHSQFPHGY